MRSFAARIIVSLIVLEFDWKGTVVRVPSAMKRSSRYSAKVESLDADGTTEVEEEAVFPGLLYTQSVSP
jgi:hypothetical protein